MPDKADSLKQIQKYLEGILDTLPSAVFIKDAEHLKFVYINKMAETFLGFKNEEMIGKNDYDFFPKDQADFFISKDRDVFKKEKMVDIHEEPIELSSGEMRWLHTKKIPFYDLDETQGNNKKPLFLVGIFDDITVRKDTEEKLKLARLEIEQKYHETQNVFKIILDSTIDGFITTDEHGIIKTYNNACNSMFGYQMNEAILFNIDKLIPELNRATFKKYKKQLSEQEGDTLLIKGLMGQNDNNNKFPINLTFKQLGQSYSENYVLIIHDITEKIIAQKQQEKHLLDLETKNRELNDFTYIASHDLKGPLRGIHNYASFLAEDYESKLDDKGKNMLFTLTNLTRQLEEYLDTLLQYSRLGRNDLNLETTNLNALIDSVASLYHPEMDKKNVTFKVNPLPNIICDSVLIKEVIHNLINNALKYNDNQKNTIEIGYIENHERHANHHVIYIADNGIGIDPKFHDAVFKIFKRLHAKDQYEGGSGSGLTISQKIVSRHGGFIWVESEGKDRGCTVCFSLPKNYEHIEGILES
tara:strand:- start:63211 stop:64794 length:1584 start_codon:yes stop_codon:yes gene_type:complete